MKGGGREGRRVGRERRRNRLNDVYLLPSDLLEDCRGRMQGERVSRCSEARGKWLMGCLGRREVEGGEFERARSAARRRSSTSKLSSKRHRWDHWRTFNEPSLHSRASSGRRCPVPTRCFSSIAASSRFAADDPCLPFLPRSTLHPTSTKCRRSITVVFSSSTHTSHIPKHGSESSDSPEASDTSSKSVPWISVEIPTSDFRRASLEAA